MSMLDKPDRIELKWRAGEAGLTGADSTAVLLEDKNFELSGTSATDGDVTYDADHGLQLQTAGGATDYEQCLLLPQAGADNVSLWREISWGTDRETEFEAVFRTADLLTLSRIECGLVLTAPSPMDEDTDADQVKISWLQGTDTNWQVNVSIGGTDTTQDSGVAVAATTVYHLAVRIDAARICRVYINEKLVHTTTALTNTVDLLPYWGVQAGTATAAATAFIREMAISRRLAD